MPKRRRMTETVKKTGKKVLATDTAQGVVGAVVDKMEEIAVDKADDAADAVKREGCSSWRPQAPIIAQDHRPEVDRPEVQRPEVQREEVLSKQLRTCERSHT